MSLKRLELIDGSGLSMLSIAVSNFVVLRRPKPSTAVGSAGAVGRHHQLQAPLAETLAH